MKESIEANWKRIELLQNQLKNHYTEQEKKIQEIHDLQNQTRQMIDKVFESNCQTEFHFDQKGV